MTNRNQVRKEAVDLTVDTNLERQPKQQKLRNAEYYDMQDVMDKLYEESCKGKSFHNLMHLITSENNILLAFRNIKNNKGSMTKGTDGKTITQYKGWSEEQFVKYFQCKFVNYHPKSVRRTEIPKVGQPDKMRPLGIPCMDDRIIQQCIIQVLEPICEARFHAHSYGFRPNRSASHAIARAQSLMNVSKLHYVVDVDIKGFFDNVNHGKLLKQMWTMGIRDKSLICIIGKILKSEIEGIGRPDKGTPQGGIISPLLSNIVLNELDWWLSDQWETKSTRYPYTHSHKYEALKKSNLKEFFFVRYADDFKILCRDYKTAKKIFIAVKEWLWERLGLEISPEKSKITNVRKKKTDFLGFALYVTKKGKKYVSKSNISEKAKKTMKTKLKEQIKVIQHDTSPHQVSQLNAMILGMHNYYNTATGCSRDFREINFVVSKSLKHRLRVKTKKAKRNKNSKSPLPEKVLKSRTYQKFYGSYGGKPKVVAGVQIFPIYGCKFVTPRMFTREVNKYTPQGRQLIHKNLSTVHSLIQYLLETKEYGKSVEYNDNRISLMAGQNGKCAVTGEPLCIFDMECHHKKPKKLGGTDEYRNLVWLKSDVHKLIHATEEDTIAKYLDILKLDDKALKKVNSLRLSAENLEIVVKAN